MKQVLKIVLFFIGSVFSTEKCAFAQRTYLGGVAGGTLSEISSNSEFLKPDSKVAGLFGLNFGFEFKNNLFVSTSVIYLNRGYRLSSYITITQRSRLKTPPLTSKLPNFQTPQVPGFHHGGHGGYWVARGIFVDASIRCYLHVHFPQLRVPKKELQNE